MLNTKPVFDRFDLNSAVSTWSSRIASIQAVRHTVEEAKNPLAAANDIILQVLGIIVKYDDPDRARMIAQAVVDEVWLVEHNVDNEQELLTKCEARIESFLTNPSNAWMLVKPQLYQAVPTTNQTVTTAVDTKVAVKADGTIKKGGKQEVALALYDKFVLKVKPEDALDNAGFIQLLIKELDMTLAGARTYAYNCKNTLGEPVGGLRKSKKGRKSV